jgi:hypothetical protein
MGYFWFADRDLYGKYGNYKVPIVGRGEEFADDQGSKSIPL